MCIWIIKKIQVKQSYLTKSPLHGSELKMPSLTELEYFNYRLPEGTSSHIMHIIKYSTVHHNAGKSATLKKIIIVIS